MGLGCHQTVAVPTLPKIKYTLYIQPKLVSFWGLALWIIQVTTENIGFDVLPPCAWLPYRTFCAIVPNSIWETGRVNLSIPSYPIIGTYKIHLLPLQLIQGTSIQRSSSYFCRILICLHDSVVNHIKLINSEPWRKDTSEFCYVLHWENSQ